MLAGFWRAVVAHLAEVPLGERVRVRPDPEWHPRESGFARVAAPDRVWRAKSGPFATLHVREAETHWEAWLAPRNPLAEAAREWWRSVARAPREVVVGGAGIASATAFAAAGGSALLGFAAGAIGALAAAARDKPAAPVRVRDRRR